MTIVTWNIQGMARHWRERRRALIEALREVQPDIVALQECAWRLRHQATQIAREVGMRAHRAGTLGLLTRAPASVTSRVLMAGARGGSRRVLMASIGSVHIWNVHLPLDSDVRRTCAESFVAWARETSGALIICGDFNEGPDGAAVTALRAAGFADVGASAGLTFPSSDARARIDFVMVRGNIQRTGERLLEARASDHHGVCIQLT